MTATLQMRAAENDIPTGMLAALPNRQRRLVMPGAALAALLLLVLSCTPLRADDPAAEGEDSRSEKPVSGFDRLPNIYIDLSEGYASSPAGSLLLGLRKLPFVTGASKSFTVSAPLTVDVTEHFSIYAGVDASTSKSGTSPWTSLTLGNWTAGFSADVIQHADSIPTVTLNGSFSRPFDPPFFGSFTTWSAGLDIDYPFDEDETVGVLLGGSLTKTLLDKPIGTIKPTVVGYGGTYHQWDNGWKLTGKIGLQYFSGAQAGALVQLKSTTTPFGALDLERFDDNDNKLFGISFVAGWMPKPAVQLTLSTPLYFVRH